MPNELNIALSTGLTVTARLVQAGAYVGSAIALSESPASSGFYTGNVPGGTSAGTYEVIFLSGTATAGSGRLFWDGTAEVDTRTINTRVQSIPTNPLLTTDTRLNNLDATISSRLASASYTAPPAASANASAVRTELTTELGRIDVAISTRLATAGYTAPPAASAIASATRTELTTELGRIDATISSRLASASYTAPTTPPTASQNASAVRTELTLELARIDQPISSRSTFDHTSDRVDIGAVQGVAVTDIDDFKADVSGIPSAVDAALADNFTAVESAIDGVAQSVAAIPEAPSTSAIASAVDAALLDNFAAITGAVDALPTLSEIEASTVLAKQATLTTLVPSGAIARIDNYTVLQAALQGLVSGVYAEALEPIDAVTPGYYRTSDGIDLIITINPDGSRRIEQA